MAIAPSSHFSLALRSIRAIGACLALAALSHAQGLVYLTATLNGAQETPPTASTATGTGCFTFDPSTNTVTWNVSFSGLLGSQTAAHLHQGAIGVAGGVVVAIPNGSPSTGSAGLTASQATQLQAGNFYVNIHSSTFPNGEIRGQMLVTAQPTVFCVGDGTAGACPCANNSVVGANEGCLNHTGTGGKLTSSGAPSIACDTLQLCATQLLGSNCIFLQGSSAPVGPFNFGDGLRCIGGTLKRMAIVPVSSGNACLGTSAPIHTLGSVTAGSTYGYAVWYRDSSPTFCTTFAYNITNGILATWAN